MRYLDEYVRADLAKKMVFLGGARQCGKTTFAKSMLAKGDVYLNWDADADRRSIVQRTWDSRAKLVLFDELHKFPRWKNWIKGLFDTREHSQFLVTGSARLDVYRRGGDSLLGRYHYWRLHPFSLCERPRGMSTDVAFDRLMTVGGFPEPFFDGDERESRRWRRERIDRVVRDDIRDLENIRDIANLSLFVDALRTRVGSTVVLSNIAEDLRVAPKTLAHWLELLERMYLVFVVRPYTTRVTRAIQKSPKVYFLDTGDVIGDVGTRFENLVATHLLKRIQFLEDRDGHRYELRYLRDKEKREVDFVVVRDGRVHELYEAKWSDDSPSKDLVRFAELLKPTRAVQLTAEKNRGKKHGALEVASARDYLTSAWRTTSL